MLPKIGITTQIIRRSKWYKQIDALGFNTIEINRQNSKLYFDLYFLEKVKRYIKGYDLSIHSGTKGIFQPHRSFTLANLATLTAEIDLCAILGAKQLVFHLNNKMMTVENMNRLRDLIDYAMDLDVRMLYESDSRLTASDAYEVLESFPDVGYVFDLGHFNNGRENGILGCEPDEFISNVKSRVEYVHASNNHGTRDEHNALSDGTLNWHHVMDCFDLSRLIKIIIEVRNIEMVESSFGDIEQYLMKRWLIPENPIQRTDPESMFETLNIKWTGIV